MTLITLYSGVPTNNSLYQSEPLRDISPIVNPITIFASDVSPLGVVAANPGSICLVTGTVPGVDDGLWQKTSGADTSGWAQASASASPTRIANPGAAIDANTSANAQITAPFLLYTPTAERRLVVTDAPFSCVLKIYKATRALFGIVIDVTTGGGGLWTTPAGLNQDYILPASSDALCGAWDVIIDVPNKTIRVVTYPRGIMEVMTTAPSAGPGDTLDLFAGGTYTGHGITGAGGVAHYQIGAPTDGSVAYIAPATTDVRSLQDLGDGSGQHLLLEPGRTNTCLNSENLYTGAAINAPWTAIGGTTGLGQQAGSPRADATVTNLIFTASPNDGIQQGVNSGANQQRAIFSVYVRCSAGTEKCRLKVTLRDGTTITTSDFVVTTTWQRISQIAPMGNIGASALTVAILNGSDGVARTIKVWGCQAETTPSGIFPYATSYIKAVGVGVSRASDILYYGYGTYPTSFLTRGLRVLWKPQMSNFELFQAAVTAGLVTFDQSIYSAFPSGFNDGIFIAAGRNGWPTAGGAGRIMIFSSDVYGVIPSAYQPSLPRNWSEPITWAANPAIDLDITAQLYRGGYKIGGALTGNNEQPLGGGPSAWPQAGPLSAGPYLVVGSGSSGVTAGGAYGRYLTAA